MDEATALRRRDEDGWDVVEDAGRGWRRVVPSPAPLRIVEEDAIRSLLDDGFVDVCVGGGGIPVVADADGNLSGVAAVIDKDLASALLATCIGAELLLITTAVEKVALDFGTPEQRWVDRLTLAEAKERLAEGRHFAAGSMGAQDRGGRAVPRARRLHGDHHRPGQRRARPRRRDRHLDRVGVAPIRSSASTSGRRPGS